MQQNSNMAVKGGSLQPDPDGIDGGNDGANANVNKVPLKSSNEFK